MKRYRFSAIIGFVVVNMLAGCGGGDSASGQSNQSGAGATQGTTVSTNPPSNIISGAIFDSSKKPVSGASIVLDAGGTALQTNTSSDGSFSLKAPAASYPEYIAGVVQKDSFKNSTLLISTKDGNFRIIGGDVILAKTETDLALLNDVNVSRIVHLGDSNFEGAANSQLQLSNSSGLSRTYQLVSSISSRASAEYMKICFAFAGRGIQSSTSVDHITFGKESQVLLDSLSDGSFQAFKYCFKTAVTQSGAAFTISSGNNDGKKTDYDDFEIINPIVTLEEKAPGNLPLPGIIVIYGNVGASGFGTLASGTTYTRNKEAGFFLDRMLNNPTAFYPTGTKSFRYDFGDGTTPVVVPLSDSDYQNSIVRYVGANVTQTHTYFSVGEKTITVSFLDNTESVISTVISKVVVN